MEGICMTCLATDRFLFSIEHASKLTLFKFLIQGTVKNPLTISYNLCWECTAQLHSVYKFQIKARKSLQTLESYFNRSLAFPTNGVYPCLSTLQSISYAIDFSTQPSVKDESGEVAQSVQLDHNYVDHDTVLPDAVPIKSENEFYMQEHVEYGLIDDGCEPILADMKPECFESDSTLSANEDFNLCESDVPKSTSVQVTSKDVFESSTKIQSMSAVDPLHQVMTHSESLEEEVTWKEILISEQQRVDLAAAAMNEPEYAMAPFKCDGCILGYWNDVLFAWHNNRYHKEEIGPYVCDICKCRFQYEIAMKVHRKTHMALYDCMKCDFNTRRHYEIVRHHNKHHSIFRYECRDCDTIFQTRSKLKRHRVRSHKSKHKCNVCGEVFPEYTLLVQHKKSHRSAKELEGQQCPICKKMIKQNMRSHMRYSHSGSDPIYCELCKKFYNNQMSYNTHLKYAKAHMASDTFVYACGKCDKRFHKEYLLIGHEKSAHTEKEKKFCCDLCPKKYAFKKSLVIHIRESHTQGFEKVRNYICEECGKAFISGTILLAHQVVHTKERPHKCSLCPDTFGFKAALYTHNKLVHEKVKRVWPKRKKKSKSKVNQTPEDKIPGNVEK